MKGDTFLLLLRLGFSLSMIFGLMWVAAKVMRRQGGRRGRVPDHLEVIERKPLTKNSSIAIVRVGGETLTVGITDNNVSLLGQVDVDLAGPPEPEVAALPASAVDLRTSGPERARREIVVPPAGTRRGVLDVIRDRTVRHIPG